MIYMMIMVHNGFKQGAYQLLHKKIPIIQGQKVRYPSTFQDILGIQGFVDTRPWCAKGFRNVINRMHKSTFHYTFYYLFDQDMCLFSCHYYTDGCH